MSESITSLPGNERRAALFLREDARKIAQRLRAAADRIDYRTGVLADRAERGQGTYGSIPSMVIHELTVELNDTPLTSLIRTASDADIAHAKGD